MCGIAGILDLAGAPVLQAELQSMCGALVHRGPDEGGYHTDGPVGLGMRRLRVIDLDTGSQPVRNEDGSVWVVFNGEIYNFAELRRGLLAAGHVFYTRSDTEVIAHLYEEHGTACVERLRGMFAFALWDARRRSLLLARDRLGVKPLYYGEAGGRLVFASELKAILQLAGVERRLRWSSLDHLLTFLTTPSSESILEGIHKLEPGHVLTASAGAGVRARRYWAPRFEPDYGKPERHFVDGVRGLLEESVRLRLVSDVPLGAFLSGGVDSSAVVATMARLTNRQVKTFSIGFGEPDYDELGYARLVAERFSTDHHERVLEPDVLDVLPDIAWFLDEPFGDSSAIPTYFVSKLASEHVTVALSGDGGDELFAGYERYQVEARERGALPAGVRAMLRGAFRVWPEAWRGRNFIRHHGMSGAERYLDACTLFRADERRRLLTPEARAELRKGGARDREDLLGGALPWLSELQRMDLLRSLPLDILTKVDRMSMAHALEAREPLLDHVLVEFAGTIPPELQLGKRVFKQALRGVLPDVVIDRRKQGFGVPLDHWFRGRLAGYLRDTLLASQARQRGIFEPAVVSALIQRHERGRDLGLQLWTLLSFELWCRAFLDSGPCPRPARAFPEPRIGSAPIAGAPGAA
jgi:asparagine synthase (glutamine-hydrolysing)